MEQEDRSAQLLMNKRPLAVICVFFICGIVLARFLPDAVRFFHIFIGTLIFILLYAVLRKASNVFLLLSITSFAALLYINSNTFPHNHISHFLGEERLKTDIVGIIKSPALTRKPYYGKINSTYLFEIEAIKGRKDEWQSVTGLAQIRIQTEKDYGYGDRLMVKGTVRRPSDDASRLRPSLRSGLRSKNISVRARPRLRRAESRTSRQARGRPFNYRQYLERQNIFALINTKETNITVLSHDYKSNPILRYTYFLRERLKNQILEKMPLDSGAFLRAILLGDRSELPKDIQTAFKNSGTMHILAISGLHIGLIALVILSLLRFLRIKREFSYALAIIILIFFALLTLSRPSVIRAVVMACVFLIGILLGRKVDVYNSLGAAALFILIQNPKDLSNVGFQLSFLAVLSIIYLVPKFMRLAKDGMNFHIRRFVYMPLAVSIAAWLGTSPLILYYFRIITPVAIISNLFIIPVLFVLLIGGMGFISFGWVPFLGPVLAISNHLCSRAIFSLTDFFASLPFSHFHLK